MHTANCPTLTYIWCEGVVSRLNAKQFILTLENVAVFVLYAMLLGSVSVQPVSRHMEAGCMRLLVDWCSNTVESATLQIDSVMGYRKAQRTAFTLTTTVIISILVYAISAAWSNARPCDDAW